MHFSLITLGALVATAISGPLVAANNKDKIQNMPSAWERRLEARQTGSNCTQHCSNAAGCSCTVRPSDCTAYYNVQPSDTCLSIAKAFGNFTVTQFYQWNPSVGQTCFGLQAYVPVCINTPWYTFTPPVQPPFGTHYSPRQTPVPIMPNVVSTCQTFELVAPGKRVDALAAANGFEVSQFADWNGGAPTAWAAYWACVEA